MLIQLINQSVVSVGILNCLLHTGSFILFAFFRGLPSLRQIKSNLLLISLVSWSFPLCLKKNMNASRPSEHSPVRGKMSKRLGGIIGCKDKTSSWHLNGFSDGSNIGSYNVGEKPATVILYTYINRHAGTPNRTKQKEVLYCSL